MAAGDVTTIREDVIGTSNMKIVEVEGPASYAAGGFALNDLDGVTDGGLKFGLDNVDYAQFEPVEEAALTMLIARWDRSTDKVLVYEAEAVDLPFAEITDADDLSTFVFRALVIGTLDG